MNIRRQWSRWAQNISIDSADNPCIDGRDSHNSHYGRSAVRKPAKAGTPNADSKEFHVFGVPPLGGLQS